MDTSVKAEPKKREDNTQIKQLNQSIDIGLKQLESGQKISASKSYERLKTKLKQKSRTGRHETLT